MPTCAEVAARTLGELGVDRIFGLPGGEILDFLEAARRSGIEFVLTRDEATASFMADVTGQVDRRPGVCASTLGPGAMNMVLGVANAYLDRSPLLAFTADLSTEAAPYATHQHLDLARIYGGFTKGSVTLDGTDTEAKVRRAYRTSLEPRMGPVHVAIPRDVGALPDRDTGREPVQAVPPPPADPPLEQVAVMGRLLGEARRPVAVLGLDLDPRGSREPVLRFLERAGMPAFATPKAKGILPEDHPLFLGVCGGVAGDAEVVDLLARADLLLGLGFDPVESDKLWHRTMRLANVGPVSIACDAYRPLHESVGDVAACLEGLGGALPEGGYAWEPEELSAFRDRLWARLRPAPGDGGGISPLELTLRLRELFPRDTLHATDVGSIKYVTSQAWRTFEPLSFFESNGLSSMGYALPAAMALKLRFPERTVLCTTGDGGLGMTVADLETCVRHGIVLVTVVYNDSSLSLIRVAQASRRYPNHGVDYSEVDFAAVARGFGAWAARVRSLEEAEEAVRSALASGRPAVVDAVVNPAEYAAQAAST